MNFTQIPKIQDRSFLIGFYLPSFLFCLPTMYFLDIPHFVSKLSSIGLTGEWLLVISAFLLSWFIATLLQIFNLPLFRQFEGYLPPVCWIFRNKLQRERISLAAEQSRLMELIVSIKNNAIRGIAAPKEDIDEYNRLSIKMSLKPSSPSDLLPTKFGNAIRVFETYSRDVYGADGVLLWSHLLLIMPKESTDLVQTARSQVDLFVNASALSVLEIPIVLDAYYEHLSTASMWNCLIIVTTCVVSALSCYRLSVGAVFGWGNLVKASFDCFLPKLAGQLGFEPPSSDQKRRTFWLQFSETHRLGRRVDDATAFKPEHWRPSAKGTGKP